MFACRAIILEFYRLHLLLFQTMPVYRSLYPFVMFFFPALNHEQSADLRQRLKLSLLGLALTHFVFVLQTTVMNAYLYLLWYKYMKNKHNNTNSGIKLIFILILYLNGCNYLEIW